MSELISIVSPVYGCTACLEVLCRKVNDAFDGTGIEWELVLVDDRGPDDPWPLIRTLAQRDERIHGIRLSRNHGQHLAIWAGLAQAKGNWVAVIDCDLQDDPTIIPELYKAALERQDEAIIVDRGSWSDSWFRRTASRTFYRTVSLLGGINIRNAGNFGLYSRTMVDTLLQFEEQEVFLPMMVALSGLSSSKFQQDRSARAAGSSAYSIWRLLKLASAIIVRFSDRPLKLSIVVGFALSVFSALLSVALLFLWSFGVLTVPGWTSTVLSVWFLSGLIMATLGVHGFYIGRIFAEVKRRPRIAVERMTSDQKQI